MYRTSGRRRPAQPTPRVGHPCGGRSFDDRLPDAHSSADRWRLALHDAPDDATLLRETTFGFAAIHAEELHDDRRLHDPSGLRENVVRLTSIDAADLHHDALGPIPELLVGRAQVDHQVAEGLAEPDHRAGGDGDRKS